jgi:hypothetical protein
MAPKECRVFKLLETILLSRIGEAMMFGFDTAIVRECLTKSSVRSLLDNAQYNCKLSILLPCLGGLKIESFNNVTQEYL